MPHWTNAIPAALASVILTSGCGGTEEGPTAATAPPAPPVTVTVAPPVTVTVAPPVTVTVQPPASAAVPVQPSVGQPPPDTAPPAPAPAGVVPNVVGLDHQLAQDTMQGMGFYNLSEEDATGANRVLLIDRNWVVVEQQPVGGTAAAADVTIVLRSKKIGE